MCPKIRFNFDRRTRRRLAELTSNECIDRCARVIKDNSIRCSRLNLENVFVSQLRGIGRNSAVYAGRWDQSLVTVVEVRSDRTPEELSDLVTEMLTRYSLLNHENLAKIFGACVYSRKSPLLVLEHCQSRSLRDYLADPCVRMSHGAIANVMLQVAKAVRYAHSRGVFLHKLTPASVMFASEPDLENNRNILVKLIGYWNSDFNSDGVSMTNQLTRESNVCSYGKLFWNLLNRSTEHSNESSSRSRVFMLNEADQPDVPQDLMDDWKEIIRTCWSNPEKIDMNDIIQMLSIPFSWL